jgi:hypothetical protein
MSVPQIVVVVTRISAFSGPTSGIRFSSRRMRPGSMNTATFILDMAFSPGAARCSLPSIQVPEFEDTLSAPPSSVAFSAVTLDRRSDNRRTGALTRRPGDPPGHGRAKGGRGLGRIQRIKRMTGARLYCNIWSI